MFPCEQGLKIWLPGEIWNPLKNVNFAIQTNDPTLFSSHQTFYISPPPPPHFILFYFTPTFCSVSVLLHCSPDPLPFPSVVTFLVTVDESESQGDSVMPR